jgi:hypothetical protein
MKEETMPKLRLLAAQFKLRTGGYTRILKNGFHRPGTDMAPRAIIEYLDTPKDTISKLAATYLPKLTSDLAQIQTKKYISTPITLVNPVTGEETTVYEKTLRDDLSASELKKVNQKERQLQNLVSKYSRSLKMGAKASQVRATVIQQMHEEMIVQDEARLNALQQKLDSLTLMREKRAYLKEQVLPFSDDPLLSHEEARRVGKTKSVVMDPLTGKLSWSKDYEAETASITAAELASEQKSATPTSQEGSEKKSGEGMLSGLFKKLSLK